MASHLWSTRQSKQQVLCRVFFLCLHFSFTLWGKPWNVSVIYSLEHQIQHLSVFLGCFFQVLQAATRFVLVGLNKTGLKTAEMVPEQHVYTLVYNKVSKQSSQSNFQLGERELQWENEAFRGWCSRSLPPVLCVTVAHRLGKHNVHACTSTWTQRHSSFENR